MAKSGLGKGLGHLMKKSPDLAQPSAPSEATDSEQPIGQGLSSLLQGNVPTKNDPDQVSPVPSEIREPLPDLSSHRHAPSPSPTIGHARSAEMLSLAGLILLISDAALLASSFALYHFLQKPLDWTGAIGLAFLVIWGGCAGATGCWFLIASSPGSPRR